LLPALFLLLGISVGVPMSGVNLFAGRNFGERCAPMLTLLNFSWSAGALAAPLLAAQVLLHHTYRAAYIVLAVASAVAALACWRLIRDTPEMARPMSSVQGFPNIKLIVVFAIAAFLQVGVENTAAAWLTTYALRMARDGVVLAAASSSVYWIGFLSSRGISSLVLLRADPVRVFRVAVAVALFAAVLLAGLPSVAGRTAAMFMLGAALAPIYPLVISGFFARARHTSDSRWVLAIAGLGGSVLPWLAGWISTGAGSLRVGILIIPAALLLMIFVLPAMHKAQPSVAVK
jgi:fucose permease